MKISSNENQKIWYRKWPAQLIINNVAKASSENGGENEMASM
jgi:hypothetical protein